MRLSVPRDCIHGRRVLASIMPYLIEKHFLDERGEELYLPCDILDERFAHVLVPLYIDALRLGVKLVEVGVDPGTARCGIALAIGEEVIATFTLPQQALADFLGILKRYFEMRLYWGGAIEPEETIVEGISDVVHVSEKDLPLVKLEHCGSSDHERDAVRILVKGRLKLANAKLREEIKD
ncbi:MAG: hypothetical protein QXU72_04680 [Thermofilum sp.]